MPEPSPTAPAVASPIASRPAAFARRLGVSRAFIYQLIERGEIVARKLGGATVIFDEDNRGLRERLPQVELQSSRQDAA
jgi:excisionase family DNA binding protein